MKIEDYTTKVDKLIRDENTGEIISCPNCGDKRESYHGDPYACKGYNYHPDCPHCNPNQPKQ